MGVPKFYRWISERYPCLSEVVKEYQVPEFDNLYLDMNGIIHTCSHPNDDDPHFRITEEQIFQDIFRYIEVLFRIIRPQKTFFMAVDGVAPRAKMNQQRGRRFRSAKEAESSIKEAIRKGETLPTDKRFDSNCITPGTSFMERLQTQLEYFVQTKITHERSWQGIDVYLSGHQTPGEGEHKIMEYIRYERSKPDYDANTRHCLYGLDADLMMLGLCTHDPHFSLLREEVKFTRSKKGSRTAKAEETTFHLLHISLLREYIGHEFSQLKDTLPFPFDLESVIDDWVLMGFLVGNDFIPHLPDLHIAQNALPYLYQTYIRVLPTLDGYLNEKGIINLNRFQAFLEALAAYDMDHFEEVYSDYKWLESKSRSNKKDATQEDEDPAQARSIKICKDLAIQQGIMTPSEGSLSDSDNSSNDGDTFHQEFRMHKKSYYESKFKIKASKDAVARIAYEYILGLQWICHYYYNGVQSWSWYYPYHYSPYMSDLKQVSTMKLKYKMNKPFLPYQQLLGVLPAASKDCIPEPFWKLMDETTSPIGDFYPSKFLTDLNGKQQEWEAVVLIPFIDETRLLEAMEPCNKHLSSSEKRRNQPGPCMLYTHDPSHAVYVKSSLPGVFPDLEACTAHLTTIPQQKWLMKDYHQYVKGLLPDCHLSVYYHGFPTLYHLKHRSYLKKVGVKVFQSMSRGENMILEITNKTSDHDQNGLSSNNESLEMTASKLLGNSVYVNWPHMEEAKVVAVCDGTIKFSLREQAPASRGSKLRLVKQELNNKENNEYMGEIHDIHERYLYQQGIEVGYTDVLVYAQLLQGRQYVCGKKGEITFEKQWSNINTPFPLQSIVKNISVQDPTFKKPQSISELYPVGGEVFNLGVPNYGCPGKIVEVKDGHTTVNFELPAEPDFTNVKKVAKQSASYQPSWRMAASLGISNFLLSRITGSIYLFYPATQKWSIGLNLRFSKEGAGIAGFTKKSQQNWVYSDRVLQILKEYLERFPEVFYYLGKALQSSGRENQLNVEEMFKDQDITSKLHELSKWLKTQPCYDGQRVYENSDIVEREVVKAIEEEVVELKSKKTASKEILVGVRPKFLHRPLTQHGTLIPDKNAQHKLLDRIVNVRDGFTVPLGYRGTIIGIHGPSERQKETLFDVIFDDEFLGGLTLGGRCPERRGYKMPLCAVINISHGDRLANQNGDQKFSRSSSNRVTPQGQGRLVQSQPSAFTPAWKQKQQQKQPQQQQKAKPVQLLKRESSVPSNSNQRSTTRSQVQLSQTNSSFEEMWQSLKLSKRATDSTPAPSEIDQSRYATSQSRDTPDGKHPIGSSGKPNVTLLMAAQSLPEIKQEVTKTTVSGKKPNDMEHQNDKRSLEKLLHNLHLSKPSNVPPPNYNPYEPPPTLPAPFYPAGCPLPRPLTYDSDMCPPNARVPPSPMQPYYANVQQSATRLMTPDSFVVNRTPVPFFTSQQATKDRNEFLKEGTEKLCEILNVSIQEEKIKEEKRAKISWSTASEDFPPRQESETFVDGADSTKSPTKTNESKSEADDDNIRSSSVEDLPTSNDVSSNPSNVDQLLTWCRGRKLYSPFYTYTDAQMVKGKYLATVTLWNGAKFQTIKMGSKDDVTEEAAGIALHYVHNLSNGSTQAPQGYGGIPQPGFVPHSQMVYPQQQFYPRPMGYLPGMIPMGLPPNLQQPPFVTPQLPHPLVTNYMQPGYPYLPPQGNPQIVGVPAPSIAPTLYQPVAGAMVPPSASSPYSVHGQSAAGVGKQTPIYMVTDNSFIPPQVMKLQMSNASTPSISPKQQNKYVLSDSPSLNSSKGTSPQASSVSSSAPSSGTNSAKKPDTKTRGRACEGRKSKAKLAISFSGAK